MKDEFYFSFQVQNVHGNVTRLNSVVLLIPYLAQRRPKRYEFFSPKRAYAFAQLINNS